MPKNNAENCTHLKAYPYPHHTQLSYTSLPLYYKWFIRFQPQKFLAKFQTFTVNQAFIENMSSMFSVFYRCLKPLIKIPYKFFFVRFIKEASI